MLNKFSSKYNFGGSCIDIYVLGHKLKLAIPYFSTLNTCNSYYYKQTNKQSLTFGPFNK